MNHGSKAVQFNYSVPLLPLCCPCHATHSLLCSIASISLTISPPPSLLVLILKPSATPPLFPFLSFFVCKGTTGNTPHILTVTPLGQVQCDIDVCFSSFQCKLGECRCHFLDDIRTLWVVRGQQMSWPGHLNDGTSTLFDDTSCLQMRLQHSSVMKGK